MAFTKENGLDVFVDGANSVYRCTGCKCWRKRTENPCNICRTPRPSLPGDGPSTNKTLAERRVEMQSYANIIRKLDAAAKANKLSK